MRALGFDEAIAVVNQLISSTRTGKLTWQLYEPAEAEYTAQSAKFVYYVNSDETSSYRLQIWRRGIPEPGKNLLVEEIERSEGDLVEKIEILYNLARNQALKLEHLKADILNDLE